jgi:hypothetical protein
LINKTSDFTKKNKGFAEDYNIFFYELMEKINGGFK